ncbi:Elongation factor 3 (EF-3) (Eukaryotic elongation factor 3) (eEF3) [Durusdinium trenchii]|uniref:Elongation factor 3 (EF-3) (Eukaryotic elongation factor 3) (EEF3) n=1 Tax=Durusdinium trenchii TaxID=1381693 RepID=A0ABP0SJJ7_9DINO
MLPTPAMSPLSHHGDGYSFQHGEEAPKQVVVDLEEPPGEKFWFPQPGPLAGVKTRGKAILKLNHATYRYPGQDKPAIRDIELAVSQASRVALLGPTGSGRSTLLQVLEGRLRPTHGSVLRVLGSRFAYVCKHSLQRFGHHKEATALQYFLWRFEDHRDKESATIASNTLSQEEEAQRKVPWPLDEKNLLRPCTSAEKAEVLMTPEKICNRRPNAAGELEYEVKWLHRSVDEKTWVKKEILMEMGYEKLVQLEDDWQASCAFSAKELTKDNVQKHLRCFEVDASASQMPMGKLSRASKIRIVLAAAMWQHPHILILDELADYMDFEDLEALKFAINRFAGGVIMVTGNEELCGMATEKWFMDGGVLHVENLVKADARSNAKTVEMPGEQERRHLIEIEKKIHQHRKKPLSDKELWQLEDELHELKEVLLNDVALEDPEIEDAYAISGLGEVIDQQLSELLMEEFGADLKNFRRAQLEFNLKLSLLVEQQPDEDPALDLLGFVAFKTWGPPVPGVSVGAVGVADKHRGKGYGRQLMKVAEDRAAMLGIMTPEGFQAGEVRLRSLASAVLFYERLGYERREDEDEGAAEKTPACPDPERPAAEEDDDDGPCVPMARKFAPFSPRSALKMGPLLSPKHCAWCPKISRALEDGPTWPTMEQLLLPEACAA